jgi:hypothetical protein
MIQNWFRSSVLLLVLTAALHGQSRESLVQSVNSLQGWTAYGKSSTFNESNIEKFDSEFASSFRIYGMSGITVQAWESPSGRTRATLFQFTDAGGAYGFFTHRRKIEGVMPSNFSVGTESFKSGKFAYFWQAARQAAFVVRLEGESRAVESLAGTLSENILGRSQRPPLSNRLPSANLIANSEEYILDSTSIPKMEGIDPSGIGFDLISEAATADYRINGQIVRLLLILYPTQQIAKKYADQIDLATPNLAASRKRIGPLLAIISGTSDASAIQSLMDQVHFVSKVTWNEPQPGLGLGPVIVTVFTFIGILLGVCILAGVGLGAFRILMKSLYPDRVFDRQQDVGIIQLKLDQELIRKEISK